MQYLCTVRGRSIIPCTKKYIDTYGEWLIINSKYKHWKRKTKKERKRKRDYTSLVIPATDSRSMLAKNSNSPRPVAPAASHVPSVRPPVSPQPHEFDPLSVKKESLY